MADIKATQTATTADTTGLSQGVQVDTSALREQGARRTALFSDAINKGTQTFTSVKLEEERGVAEQASTGFFEEISEIESQVGLSQEQFDLIASDPATGDDEGEFGRNAVLDSIQQDVALLQRRKGQLSTAHFDLLMASKQNESINKYPWMEKSIASMYGDVTGRTKAVRDVMKANESADAKVLEKILTASISILKANSIPLSTDAGTNINNANQIQADLQSSVRQKQTGTTGTGYSGFTKDRSGNLLRYNQDMITIVRDGEDIAVTQSQLNDTYLAEIAFMETAYGDIPSGALDAHKAQLKAKFEDLRDLVDGTTTVDVLSKKLEQQNVYSEAKLRTVPGVNAMMVISSKLSDPLIEGMTASIIAQNPDFLRGISDFVLDLSVGDARTAGDTVSNLSGTERKSYGNLAQAHLRSYLTDGAGPKTPESTEVYTNQINSMSNLITGDSDYHSDQYFSLTDVTASKEFYDSIVSQDMLGVGSDSTFDVGSLQAVGVNGMDEGLTQTVDTLAQTTLQGSGALLGQFVELYVNEDGTVQARTTGLEGIDGFFPDERRRERSRQQVSAVVDSLNRGPLHMVNNGGKTHAHINGNTNYRASIGFKLAEFGLAVTDEFAPSGMPTPSAGQPADTINQDSQQVDELFGGQQGDRRTIPVPSGNGVLIGNPNPAFIPPQGPPIEVSRDIQGDRPQGTTQGGVRQIPFPTAGTTLDINELKDATSPTAGEFLIGDEGYHAGLPVNVPGPTSGITIGGLDIANGDKKAITKALKKVMGDVKVAAIMANSGLEGDKAEKALNKLSISLTNEEIATLKNSYLTDIVDPVLLKQLGKDTIDGMPRKILEPLRALTFLLPGPKSAKALKRAFKTKDPQDFDTAINNYENYFNNPVGNQAARAQRVADAIRVYRKTVKDTMSFDPATGTLK